MRCYDTVEESLDLELFSSWERIRDASRGETVISMELWNFIGILGLAIFLFSFQKNAFDCECFNLALLLLYSTTTTTG